MLETDISDNLTQARSTLTRVDGKLKVLIALDVERCAITEELARVRRRIPQLEVMISKAEKGYMLIRFITIT